MARGSAGWDGSDSECAWVDVGRGARMVAPDCAEVNSRGWRETRWEEGRRKGGEARGAMSSRRRRAVRGPCAEEGSTNTGTRLSRGRLVVTPPPVRSPGSQVIDTHTGTRRVRPSSPRI